MRESGQIVISERYVIEGFGGSDLDIKSLFRIANPQFLKISHFISTSNTFPGPPNFRLRHA